MEWEELIRLQNFILQDTEVFGKTIHDVLLRYPNPPSEIPVIFENLISEIENTCTEISGVFRISGSITSIVRTKNLIDRNIPVDLSSLDCHVLTGVLKQLFREMEDPIIPINDYSKFLSCTKGKLNKIN